MVRITKIFLLLITPIMIFISCIEEKNTLNNYLDDVELQFETNQLENIKMALKDALTLSSEELESKRYEDYTGTPNQWDLRTLFEKHFMPDDPQKKLGENFYTDIKSEDVQNTIRHIYEKLTTIEP
ncbi:hypothetical protein JW824_06950 [bacterium]|nr:hypothetical protein [bacterium]